MAKIAIALIIDWTGPFKTVKDACKFASGKEIIYIACGKTVRMHNNRMQYVGIANIGEARLKPDHNKIIEIKRDLALWIGFIASHSLAGRRLAEDTKKHRVELELAESGIAYFLQLPLNVRKKKSVPRDSFVLLSRWFKSDETRWKKRAHPDWPNLIEYDDAGDVRSAAKVWFGARSKIRRLSAKEIDELGKG